MISEKEYSRKLDEAIHEAVANAIERHRKLGESIVVSENGKVVILSPEEILKRQQQGKA
ncbi:MAG TPA: hypothetical protein VGV92_01310 [Gammaproteobacteria bacterium]|nr:hypothetical protein [Gammaproteobacteria bacterium]